MPGTVCLQGGGEFSPACREMDADLVRRAAGPVVVTALAGAPGPEYDVATGNGVRHFRALGAEDVVGAPDARADPAAALAVLRSARLLVLPGGSPSRLLSALTGTGVDAVVRDLLAAGGVVMGASAGAMVLCPWTVLPDARVAANGLPVAPGLGVVGQLAVVPHWTGEEPGRKWLDALSAVPGRVHILGIPEESGVLVEEEDALTAVGTFPTRLVTEARDLAPGETWRLP
jgi:cyanophycinase-like exopeptidase